MTEMFRLDGKVAIVTGFVAGDWGGRLRRAWRGWGLRW